MADTSSGATRGLLVGGVVLLWVIGMIWILHRKGVVTTERDDTQLQIGVQGDKTEDEANYGDEPVSEIVLQGGPTPEEEEEAARVRARAEREAATERRAG